jgi:hypothetical protein
MPITRHHSGRWLFQFDKIIAGSRVRANKVLPKGTTKPQADDFDRRETARLWQIATGGRKPEPLIEDAVLIYLERHAPDLKNRVDLEGRVGPADAALRWPAAVGAARCGEGIRQGRQGRERRAAEAGHGEEPASLPARCLPLGMEAREGVLRARPAERMVLPKVKNARHVYLTREQALPVFRKMGLSWSRDAARVAFYTGWRISEVLSAVPVKIDGDLCLSIPDSKNDAPRIVPVHAKITHLVARHWPPQVTKWTASKATKARCAPWASAMRDCTT